MDTVANLHSVIDHTILRPDAQRAEVLRFCAEARAHAFFSVCVNPVWIPVVAAALAGSEVATCSVIGFPLGAIPTPVKAAEAAWVVAAGATEVDMVIDIGALKDGDLVQVQADIAAVKAACGPALLKVIIETCLLSDAEKVAACHCAVAAGANFVKTSTGFSTGGATVADVALMRATVGPTIGVKASGGIRTRADALAMLAAGASRIGASAGLKIISE
ncbi:deoxyribose-phosphate aldolase [Siculibacillus lacustris]|uniref:Deoxyribose-phosphate aldolase n=1 Tax=Siculibacillus lacustris TaxID=1549641 RepID=A0A4Q9VY16_9HYPH|nr:deoxyribose-phosphate aldolase [Siculibacillus lacustris]TBW41397.1 deoxyribose-phosphate aldolase [Siculibacillus lacustris]